MSNESSPLASAADSTPARQEPFRVMVVDDAVVIRGLISRWIDAEPDMVVAASLRTGLRGGRAARAHQSRRRRARHRNAGARRHLRAAAAAREEARSRRHHGVDADPPQRGDQLQGALARRRRLHSEAGDHPRADGRRDLPPRSDREDPRLRRQGSPRRAAACIAAAGARSRMPRAARRRRCACARAASRGRAAGR